MLAAASGGAALGVDFERLRQVRGRDHQFYRFRGVELEHRATLCASVLLDRCPRDLAHHPIREDRLAPVDRDLGGLAAAERRKGAVGLGTKREAVDTGVGDALAAHRVVLQFYLLIRRGDTGEVRRIVLGVAAKATVPVLLRVLEVRGQPHRAVGEAAAEVVASAGEPLGVVRAGVGPQRVQQVEPSADIVAEALGLVVAWAEAEVGRRALADRPVRADHVALDRGDRLRARLRRHRVEAVH